MEHRTVRGAISDTSPGMGGVTGVEAGDATTGAHALASAVMEAEAEREARQAESAQRMVFADELLPGVGAESLSLRDGLRRGGVATFAVLLLLVSFDELEQAALSVLAPDIRDSFGISSGAIVFIASAAGAFIVLGSLPMGWLADRHRRPPIIAWAGIAFSAFVALCGLVTSAFQFFWARFGVGLAKSSNLPVHGSMIADSYPIGVRGRISASMTMSARAVGALSPLIVGGLAALSGGPDGWRLPYLVLGIPVAVVALFAFRLPEPSRGQFEMQDVLGKVLHDERPVPISVEAAFSRLWQIKTVKAVIVAFAAMGFGLFTAPVLANLFMDEEYGADAFTRGLLTTVGGLALLLALPLAGRHYDRLYRSNPARALRLLGLMLLPAALVTPVQYFMPNVVLFTIAGIPQLILLTISFTMVGPLMQTIIPYRLRGMGSALAAIYIFFIGATGGALLSALLVDEFGPRTAVLALVVPATIIGGFLVVRSAGYIRNDLSLVVEELQEELDEHRRQSESPDDIPAIQVNDIDFSYGHVQVLFDVAFEVRRGEVLALLGTNGAGKSTILRAIAGLGTPARGVVRLNGRNITYATPEQRSKLGIQILIGGKGIFPAMTVRENLVVAAVGYRADRLDFDRRIARAFALFPDLDAKQRDPAGALSGGQQQMLALAMTLLHEPEVLMIDELSLGLAPVLVEQLLEVVEQLKSEGVTIILVEQSLNVALTIADRAVFLEKGQIRFSGPARDLAERDDLARAVFLGREGEG